MATLDVIKTITIRGKSEGVAEVTRELEKLSAAQKDVAITAEQSSKATLSVDTALQRLQRRYDQEFRAQQDLARVSKTLDQARAQGLITQQRAGDLMQQAIRAHNQTTEAGTRSATMWRALAHEVGLFSPQLAEVVHTVGNVDRGFGHLGISLAALSLTFAALVAGVIKAITAFAEFETRQARFTNALALTGGASGQTAESLEKLAHRLSESGTVSIDAARGAEQALLAFRRIGTDAFEPTLEIARRLSETGFVKLEEAATSVAKALQDPTNATKALEAAFVELDPAQQRVINQFIRQGDIVSAQAVIMKNLEEQTKAIAGSADTLAAAWTRFLNTFEGTAAEIGKAIAEFLKLKEILDTVSEVLRSIGQGPQRSTFVTVGGVTESEAEKQARNLAEIAKRAGEVNIELDKTAVTAGKSALQQKILNETVLKGIPLETEYGQEIAKRISAQESATANRAILDGLKQQTAALQAQVEAFGMSTAAATSFKIVQEEIAKAKIAGTGLDVEAVKKQADEIGRLTQQLEELQKASQATGEFINTFVEGLVRGDSAAQSFSKSLQGLGASITRAATNQLGTQIVGTAGVGGAAGTGITGLLGAAGVTGAALAPATAGLSLAIGAGISLLGKLFDDSKEKAEEQLALQQEQLRIQEVQKRLAEATQSAIAASTQLADAAAGAIGNFAKQLRDITTAAVQLQQATSQLGGGMEAVVQQVIDAQNRLRANIVQSLERSINEATGRGYINQAADLIDRFNDAAQTLAQTGIGITQEQADLVGRFLSTGFQQIIDQAQLTGDAFNELVGMFPQVVGNVHEFQQALEATAAATRDVTSTVRDLTARQIAADFAAGGIRGSLEERLMLFDVAAQTQREAEIAAGGQELARLEQVLATERIAIVREFNDNVLEETQRAEQQRLETIQNANRQIAEYLEGLLTGPGSPLNPRARLARAQYDFNQQLLLAQQGNLDALAGITSVAETLRTAAQAFYGSSRGYVDIFNTIQGQLSTLAGGGGSGIPLSSQTGGWVYGGSPGRDSVPLLAMPGEFMVRRSVAQSNAENLTRLNATGRWGANDNVEALLASLLQETKRTNMTIAQQTQELNRESRFESRKTA